MKKIILLFEFVICFKYIYCNESILSKLHQHKYKIKDVRSELISYNKDYFNIFEVKTFKYNRTTTAHNCTLNFKRNVADNLEALTELYRFLSNEYRPMAARFQINLQKSFQSNAMGLRAITKCGNTTSFYFYKDITYHICNFVIDETQLPPLMSNGRYKLEFKYLLFNKEAAVVNLYGEVYTPIEYPNKK